MCMCMGEMCRMWMMYWGEIYMVEIWTGRIVVFFGAGLDCTQKMAGLLAVIPMDVSVFTVYGALCDL